MNHLSRRSRRNLLRIAAITTSAMAVQLTPAKQAAARPWFCLSSERFCPPIGPGNGHRNCYLKGTTIRTVEGDRSIEALAIGDLLPTVFGGIQPIQRIENFRIVKSDPSEAWEQDALPVRIAQSALGPDLPQVDLYLTKAHALLINGVLVPAGSLVNGDTITVYGASELDALEYFHIVLERHDVIFAEGAPCETLLASELYVSSGSSEAGCAPRLSFTGGRNELAARLRSALSPLIDCRTRLDMIRDDLEDAGILRAA